MSYIIHMQSGTVTREADGVEVAPCQSAKDPNFVAYIDWVNAGNEPRVVDYPMPSVPQSITRAQAIGTLILAGLDDEVQPAIDAIADPILRKLAQNDWDNRLTFERDNATLNHLAQAIGMTSEQLDQLFIQAATL